jgi:succinyl-diaminopimelate desuccinylase
VSDAVEARLLAAIDGSANEMADLAHALVAVPTENPPGTAYEECVSLLEERVTDLGLRAERVALSPTRTALVAGFGDGPAFILHGHYDVVPASVPGQFTPRTEAGRLIGRGSADMKGGIASMAYAAAALSTVELPGRVELVLVPDEETGGVEGTGRLAAMGRLGRDGVGAIVAEPTSGSIWNGSRGAVTLRVTVRGRPAHVGLQFRGVNAFEKAIPILDALKALKDDVETRRTSFTIRPDVARASILMLGGEVRGGHQFNLVPDRFSFTVERRFNPEEDLAAERDRLLGTVREATPRGVEVEVEVLQEAPSSGVPEDDALVRSLSSVVEERAGKPPYCELCPGLLETRFYAEAGVPAVAYGPGDLEVAHGPDESVSLRRVLECAGIYALTAWRALQRR